MFWQTISYAYRIRGWLRQCLSTWLGHTPARATFLTKSTRLLLTSRLAPSLNFLLPHFVSSLPFSLFFLFVSHTISFFLLSSVSFFFLLSNSNVLCSHSLLFRIFSSLFVRRGFICYLSLCCNLKPILDVLLQQISR